MSSVELKPEDACDLWGTVVAVQANFYRVQLESPSSQISPRQYLLCTRRSRLKKSVRK